MSKNDTPWEHSVVGNGKGAPMRKGFVPTGAIESVHGNIVIRYMRFVQSERISPDDYSFDVRLTMTAELLMS